MIYEILSGKSRVLASVIMVLVSFSAMFLAMIRQILPQDPILAALGGLSIGLLIEAIAGTDFGNARKKFRSNDWKGDIDGPSIHVLISDYVRMVGAALQRTKSEHGWPDKNNEGHIEILSNATYLSRKIIDMDVMSGEEVQVLSEIQKMLVSYMLSPAILDEADMIPEILSRLGFLTTAGVGEVKRV